MEYTPFSVWSHPLYLCELLVFEGDLSIVADLPQGGPEAPLVGGDAEGRRALHALGSDPRDAMHTLCNTHTGSSSNSDDMTPSKGSLPSKS